VSAQDDVLAAFGEPRRPLVERAAVVEVEDAAVEVEEGLGEAAEPVAETEEPVAEVEGPAVEAEAVAVETVAVEAEEAAVEAEQPALPAGDVTVDAAEGAVEAEQRPVADGEESASEAVEPSLGDEESVAETAEQTVPAQAPSEPPQLYLDPSAFFTQLQAESAPEPKRRWPRLLLRYASALALAAAIGAGTAYHRPESPGPERRATAGRCTTPICGSTSFPCRRTPSSRRTAGSPPRTSCPGWPAGR
jgi:hypothetical protein